MKAQEIVNPRVVAHPAYPVGDYSAPVIQEEKIVDPRQVFRALVRRFPLFLATMLTTFLGIAVLTFQTVPTYSSNASIIIDANGKSAFDLTSALQGAPPDTALVDTEVEILRSRSLAEKIVAQLDLVNVEEFNPNLQEPGTVDNIKSGVAGFINQFTGREVVEEEEPELPPEIAERREIDLVVTMLLEKTSARRIGTTYGIDIAASSHDPVLAASIANAIADQYLVEQLDAKFEQIRTHNAWLESQLEDLKAEVAEAESTVEAFRAASGLITSGTTTINEQQMTDINRQLTVQRQDLARAEARLASARRASAAGSGSASAEVLNSPAILELRRQQAALNEERADLETRYGPRHPNYAKNTQRLSDIERQIATETSLILGNLEEEVAIAQQQVRTLERNLNAQRNTLVTNNRAQVRLRELERNAEASRSVYEEFLASFKQTSSQEGITSADARILSRAAVPLSPSFPKTTLNLAIGFILGIMLGTLAVILAESLNNRLNSGEDIEEDFGVPFLGNFPKLTGSARRNPANYVIENPTSSYAEALRNLRASIMFADLDTNVQTIAITSSQPDEGKTTTTYGLGRMSAMSGTRTLIIDGDFRRRQLTGKACPDPDKGFLECLFGEASLEESIVVDPKSGLHILPLTEDRHTPRDVFGSKAFDALMDILRKEYEMIIIDTGPLLLMAETRVLTSKVDQVVVVARWQKTNRAALKQTLGILKDFRAQIAGVVLNQVDVNKYHRHGYGHSGYRAYAKYYSKD